MLNPDDRDLPEDSVSFEMTYGVSTGLAAGYMFNNHIGLFGQLLYSSQGQDHRYFYRSNLNNEQDTTISVLHQLRQRYFKIPLLFKLTTDGRNKFVYGIELGPQLDYLVSIDESNNETRYAYPYPPGQVYTDFPDRIDTFERLNLSLAFAAGVDIKLRFNLKMNVQFRMDYGFFDLEDKGETFNLTERGNTRSVDYYGTTPDLQPNYARGLTYQPDRASTHPLTAGLTIGFTYLFIPDLHYN